MGRYTAAMLNLLPELARHRIKWVVRGRISNHKPNL